MTVDTRSLSSDPQVLAIGVDAFEPSLLDAMLEDGELPALRSLIESGSRSRVGSPATIGSGAVWPSFTTGQPAIEHGIHSQWSWDPAAMALTPVSLDALEPFWNAISARGSRVAVLDIPFTRPQSPRRTIEVVEWGAHDWVVGATRVHPPEFRGQLRAAGDHPFAARPRGWWIPQNEHELARFAERAVAGVRQRGELALRMLPHVDLALIGFSEVHRAGHVLWQTIAPPEERPGAFDADPEAMRNVVRETDRQIGRLVDAAGPDATVLVFSLHGMCITRGGPTILNDLLEARGLAVHQQRATGRRSLAAQAIGVAKRFTPLRVKWIGHRLLPVDLARRIQGPGVPLAPYDWSKTVAFSLPTDQHGWIRLNLRGRERDGIVEPSAYDSTCAEISDWLRSLEASGQPLVREVLRTASTEAEARRSVLPDLVLHWNDEVTDREIEVDGRIVSGPLQGTEMTGQHAPEGFLVVRGAGIQLPSEIRAEELADLITGAVPTATRTSL